MRRRALVAVGLFALVACNEADPYRREDDGQRLLAEKLQSLEQRQSALTQQLVDRKRAMEASVDQLRALKIDQEMLKLEVETFINTHQMAVACVYAPRINSGQNREFSKQTEKCARIAGVVCSLAMLSGKFRAEVARAAEKLDGAERRAKSIKSGMAALEKTIASQRAEVDAARIAVDAGAVDVADMRQRLAVL